MLRCSYLIIFAMCVSHLSSTAQVAANKTGNFPDPSAIMDVSGDDGGMLIPRMTLVERDAIVDPATSLMIYQTDIDAGFYYNSGTASLPIWSPIGGECSQRTPISSLPYTISTAGSYYLTDYLTGTAASNGITVNASHVSIDLNGYGLDGDSQSGLAGISIQLTNHHITISNGHITQWAHDGISGSSSEFVSVSNIHVDNCNQDGIELSNQANVTHCTVVGNNSDGIDVGTGSVISNCIASMNNSDGFEIGTGSNISHSDAKDNGDDGFDCSSSVVVSSCNSYSNTGNGFNLGIGANVHNCASRFNSDSGYYFVGSANCYNNIANNNSSYGYRIYNDSYIHSNSADSNTGDAFYVSNNNNTLESNVATDHTNAYNIQGTANLVIKNTSSNCTTSSISVAGNLIASFLDSSDFAGNSLPHANFEN